MHLAMPPCPQNYFYAEHVQLLLQNYQQLLGKPLIAAQTIEIDAEQLFHADFVVLSHGTEVDPIFNYANLTAMALFELSWSELTSMPSRYSAEPVERSERERLLSQVASLGYVENYSGVRVAKSGKRFYIENAVVWNLYDKQQQYVGQAACFSKWRELV